LKAQLSAATVTIVTGSRLLKKLHQYQVFAPESGLLHWLHMAIGNVKDFVGGTYHGLAEKHLQMYLDEYCYRFNRRFFRGELFSRLLCAVVSSAKLGFVELNSIA